MAFTVLDGFKLVSLALQAAPSIVTGVEIMFRKSKPGATSAEAKADGEAKKAAALSMAETGLVTALNVDPAAFGPPERDLVVGVHDQVVKYFNAKGWPVSVK